MKYPVMMKLVVVLLFALAASPFCVAQAQLAGDWQGTLNANGTPFRVAWHVFVAKDGTVTSTLDNLDQAIFGIKVKSTTLVGSSLNLSVDDDVQAGGESVNVRGTLVGTVNKDGSEMTGAWTQENPPQPPAELTMKHTVGSAAPAAAPAAAAAQPQIAGDWLGTVSAGGSEIHLLLHISAAKDGTLSATLDSVDQGANDIPVSAISLKDSKLSVTVSAAHATYEGTVNNDASAISGTWSQGQPLELNFKRAQPQAAKPAPKPAAPSDIDGTWLGLLDAGGTTLHLVLQIANMQDGLSAKLQSPDQNEVWVSANSVTRSDGNLTVTFKGMGATFEGKIAADLNTIDGTFTQAGVALPLVVKR